MTQLRPTPSRGFFSRIPWWAVVVVAALAGALLVGAGLLLTGQKDSPAPVAGPTCRPTSKAVAAVPPTKPVKVNVYNATDRIGLARETADLLAARGFTVDEVANDPVKAKVAGTALVRYEQGQVVAARWVAAQVPGATIARVSSQGRNAAKVDLVIGNDYSAIATTPDALAAFAASAPKPVC